MSGTFSDDYVRFCAGLGYGRSTVVVLAAEVLDLRARVAELEAERDSAHDCIVEMQTEIARLGLAADMAYREGAESMRERAATYIGALATDTRERFAGRDASTVARANATARVLDTLAEDIRALPLDDEGSDGAQGGE